METKERQKLLAVIAVAGLVLLVGRSLVFEPMAAFWRKRAERVASLSESISRGALLIEREAAVRSRWSHMRTNTLPSNPSAAESRMLEAFERWSQESRLSISSIKPQWKQPGEDYMTLECRADAAGSLGALSRFIYEIEKDPLGIRIESAQITSRDNNGQQLSLAIQVSGLMLAPDRK